MCYLAGAQKEGAAGFFKGVGKGLVGAVARPTGGIIDMASSTFQGIKRYVITWMCCRVEGVRSVSNLNKVLVFCQLYAKWIHK